MPPPPEACNAYVQPALGCDASRPLPEQLAGALGESESLTRDRKLACAELEAGDLGAVIRALRADLAPVACADAIVVPFLEHPSGAVTQDDESVLLGMMVAARLSRLVGPPPALTPPFDKPHFQEFFENELKPWVVAEALAIGKLSLEGAKLHGYGKAVAAVEAGLSDLRFVQAVRKVPLPTELASDPEVSSAYYAALDEALEPRKARGRDAALVGLRLFAELGALQDPRVARARALLSELYGGRRVDALDRLLIAALPPLELDTVEQKLAARLPTYSALRLLSDVPKPGDEKLLRAFAERGLPATLRARLDVSPLSRGAQSLYAAIELRRGIVYFSAPAFAHAAELGGGVKGDAAAELSAALGQALADAPKDAAALMLANPHLQTPLGSSAALEKLAGGRGRYAAEAEFDAAYLASLTPSPDPQFWRDLSARYARAAKQLKDPGARSAASELADDAEKTAQAIEKPATP